MKYIKPSISYYKIEEEILAISANVGIDPDPEGDWIYDWETGGWIWRPRNK